MRRYAAAVDPDTPVVSVPPLAIALLGAPVMRRALRRTVGLLRAMRRPGECGDATEANRLLGAPTTTSEAWRERRRVPGQEGVAATGPLHPPRATASRSR